MEKIDLIVKEDISKKICDIRNVQVMLDIDLAQFYGVSTKVLNQAVKRNLDRFPKDFMFQLTENECEILRSQIVTSSLNWGGRRYLPFAFTEQGVAMLSGVLKSERAVYINIYIMRAFVSMRRFIHKEAAIFARLDNVEKKELEDRLEIKQIKNNTAKDFEKIFETIEDRVDIKKHQIFFDGQVFDAYKFVNDILKNAKKSIILIDNYIDESVLILFSELKNVTVTIYTENLTEKLKLDLEKYNQQYPKIEIKTLKKCHDRFLIIDNKEIYYIGASIKDLGKKWFAFSKLDKESLKIVSKLG